MTDDVELEALLEDLYRAPSGTAGTVTVDPARDTAVNARQLRSGLSDDQLKRLQDAIALANDTHSRTSRDLQRKSMVSRRRVVWALAAAASITGAWLLLPRILSPPAPGGWVLEAEQQLRTFRSTQEDAVVADLPTYGPNSMARLVFRRPNGSDDIGVVNVAVYQVVNGQANLVRARAHLRTTPKMHVVTIEERGRALFGDKPGVKNLRFVFISDTGGTFRFDQRFRYKVPIDVQ